MAARTHLTPEGPRPCRASKRPCKYGEGAHYPTLQEAQAAWEKQAAATYEPLASLFKDFDLRALPQEESRTMVEAGFGGLTPPLLADRLLAIDGAYGSIEEGDLQHGSCGDLAAHMSKVYGTEHVVVADTSYQDQGRVYSLHAASRLPDGRLLDSRGVWRDEAALLEAWGGADEEGYRLITEEELKQLDPSWARFEEDPFPTAKVRDAAQALGEALGLQPREG